MRIIRSAALLLLLTSAATAQNVSFFGQIRERSEFDARTLDRTLRMDVPHYLRTRFGAALKLNDRVGARIEMQDARVFGEKRTTANTGSPNFDMRQGYVEVNQLFGAGLTARVGRTALSYANQRFIGLNDWGNTGQSFDGGMLRYQQGALSVDLLGFVLARNLHQPAAYNRDVFLTGVWGTWKPEDVKSALHVFYLYDNPKTATMQMYRHTAGINANGRYGAFDFDVDAALQFGDHMTAGMTGDMHSISANMVGIRVGYTFADLSDLRIAVGLDRLSGNDPSKTDTYGAFSTLYGTKHAFLGYMDYFRDVPADAAGLGIQDIVIMASFKPDTDITFAADFHLFSTVTDPTKLPGASGSESSSIGVELDATLSWKLAELITMTGGYSSFNGSEDRVLLVGRKTTTWGYLMATLNF